MNKLLTAFLLGLVLVTLAICGGMKNTRSVTGMGNAALAGNILVRLIETDLHITLCMIIFVHKSKEKPNQRDNSAMQ